MISTWRGSQPPRRSLHDVLQDHENPKGHGLGTCWNLAELKAPDVGDTPDYISFNNFLIS